MAFQSGSQTSQRTVGICSFAGHQGKDRPVILEEIRPIEYGWSYRFRFGKSKWGCNNRLLLRFLTGNCRLTQPETYVTSCWWLVEQLPLHIPLLPPGFCVVRKTTRGGPVDISRYDRSKGDVRRMKVGDWLLRVNVISQQSMQTAATEQQRGCRSAIGSSESMSYRNRARNSCNRAATERVQVGEWLLRVCHIATEHATAATELQQRGCRSAIGSSKSMSYLARMSRDEIKRDTVGHQC